MVFNKVFSTNSAPPGTPLEDVPNVKQALELAEYKTISELMPSGARNLCQLARIHLSRNATIIDYEVSEVSVGLNHAKALNYSQSTGYGGRETTASACHGTAKRPELL